MNVKVVMLAEAAERGSAKKSGRMLTGEMSV
jgi:hypothetical protein